MNRVHHGDALLPEPQEAALKAEADGCAETVPLPPDPGPSWPFKFMFPILAQDDTKLLPINGGKTVEFLHELGKATYMEDSPFIPGVDIPTAYTFFGQFVDHDITHEATTLGVNLSCPNLLPLAYDKVLELRNARSPNLELDSVYGSRSGFTPPPDDNNPAKLKIDPVDHGLGFPLHCDKPEDRFNDLPRAKPNAANPMLDRIALIGDVRNDENIITAQLHVAFLHAHNALIDRKYDFDTARKMLIQHYQEIVLNDFLPRITNPTIFNRIRTEGPIFFKPTSPKTLFTPLEFSVAAYRFGHSKIRPSYEDFNSLPIHSSAPLDQLFTFSRFGGPLGGPDALHIPDDWIIDWEHFLKPTDPRYFSRAIDTRLADGLFDLLKEQGADLPLRKKNLALRNLLRGYYLRMPTGQAIAEAMHREMPEIVPLTPAQIEKAVTYEELPNGMPQQGPILREAGFLEHTPLWFYILAEAKADSCGNHLGPVGSVIVAETLIGMLRYSDYSILDDPDWVPTLPSSTPGHFNLEDLLKFAGVYRP